MQKDRRWVALAFTCMMSVGASAQRIDIKNRIVDCGQIVYRQPITVEYELTNSGNRPLIINKVLTSCGCAMVDYPKEGIPADGKAKLRVTYDAKQMGHFNKQIGIYSNASKEPEMLTLRGVVVDEVVDFVGDFPYSLGELKVDTTEIMFDNVNSGDRPQAKIHVFNNSASTAQPVVMHLPGYLSAEVSPSKIAPGHSGVVTVTLNSTLLRDYGLSQTSVYLGFVPGDKVSSDNKIDVSAILLPSFHNLSESQLASAPKVQLSTTTLYLGSFEGKSKCKGEIIIQNTGKEVLVIDNLQMMAAGLELSLNTTKIAPGESARLKVTAIAKVLRRVKAKPRILLITNDPAQAKILIDVVVKE